jgi:hypothetical protein
MAVRALTTGPVNTWCSKAPQCCWMLALRRPVEITTPFETFPKSRRSRGGGNPVAINYRQRTVVQFSESADYLCGRLICNPCGWLYTECMSLPHHPKYAVVLGYNRQRLVIYPGLSLHWISARWKYLIATGFPPTRE